MTIFVSMKIKVWILLCDVCWNVALYQLSIGKSEKIIMYFVWVSNTQRIFNLKQHNCLFNDHFCYVVMNMKFVLKYWRKLDWIIVIWIFQRFNKFHFYLSKICCTKNKCILEQYRCILHNSRNTCVIRPGLQEFLYITLLIR